MRYVTTALLAGAFMLMGCTNSDSDGSSLAMIHGTVTLHGPWPAEGDIQVSLFSTWHPELPVNIAPQGPPDFHTEALLSPTPLADTHILTFEIPDINPGTYPSLVVGWRNGGQAGLDEPVLGLYGASFATNDSLPTAITLAAGEDLEFNFEGWLDRVPEIPEVLLPGQVGGTVVFSDSWPTAFNAYYVLLMTSSSPAAPSQPLAGAMAPISAANPDFLFNVQFADSLDCHLVVYGYPYTTPLNAFYGGYGWDWDAASPALSTITLREGEAGLGNLTLNCRSGE